MLPFSVQLMVLIEEMVLVLLASETDLCQIKFQFNMNFVMQFTFDGE